MMIAHIKSNKYQTISDHSINAGHYAASCLSSAALSNCGLLTGYLHDMGKCRSDFQDYLVKSDAWNNYDKGVSEQPDFSRPVGGSVIHTFHGCIYLLEKYHEERDYLAKVTSEILACAIASHHGLMDCEDLNGISGFIHRLEYDRRSLQYNETVNAFYQEVMGADEIDELFKKAEAEIGAVLQKIGRCAGNSADKKYIFYETSMLIRLITSALMYGDRRDTAEFMSGETTDIPCPDWKRDIRIFEKKYSGLKSDSNINKVRGIISDQCREAASEQSNIYRLNVPTGGGKTLSSLRCALYHAAKYKKKQIIFVMPTLSIIEQNASIIKKYLSDEYVLEHHSDVITDDMSTDELSMYDLMKDRWDAPVIVTTQVRILDILFSAKTGDTTRMQALVNAIIVFDEVQSIPNKMLSLFTGALNFLKDVCDTDVILSSATQPVFEKTEWPLELSDKKIVELDEKQLLVFDRHRFHLMNDGNDTDMDSLAETIGQMTDKYKSIMIVCNTKSEAKKLFQMISEDNTDITVSHLSAGMCKAHRKKILDDARGYLNRIIADDETKPFVFATTQLIEAGVDISFQCVVRLLAGDDSIVQAAGRCNRSGEYGSGDVYIVKLKDEARSLKNLPDIALAKKAMSDVINTGKRDIDPESPDVIDMYYSKLYAELDSLKQTMYPFVHDGQAYCIGSILGNDLSPSKTDKRFILNQPFKTAGQVFKVFDDNTYTVLVPYGKGNKLIEDMKETYKHLGFIPKETLTKASDYSVQVYSYQMEKLEENRMIRTICGGSMYEILSEAYSDDFGIDPEAEYKTDDFIL